MKTYLLPLLGIALLAPSTALVATTPASAAVDSRTTIKIKLTGPAVGTQLPEGGAEYRSNNTKPETSFRVGVEHLALPAGSILTIELNGAAIGTIKLNSLGYGSFSLRSDQGQTVPVIAPNDQVVVKAADGSVLLSGHF